MNKFEEEKLYTLAFSFIPSIGPAKLDLLKDFFSSIKRAWSADKQTLLRSGIGEKATDSLIKHRKLICPHREIEKLQQVGISFITKTEPFFPKLLREIHSCPFILFYVGDIEILKQKTLAVVGPRLPTHYGKNVTEKIVHELSLADIVVVSGMAKGVDSIAHQTCTTNNKPTAAILGSGIEVAKKTKANLAQINTIIANGGVVLSEYPPFFQSTKYTFPARNRIISGVSLGTIVIEAGLKSGTLITARLSLEQNREVFAVPGNIFSEQSLGTNKLLKNGATPLTCVRDVFDTLNFSCSFLDQNTDQKPTFSDVTEAKIYQALSVEPLHVDALAKKTNLQHTVLLSKLSLLELANLAQNVGGGMFVRK